MVSRELVDMDEGLASGRFVEVDTDYRERIAAYFGVQAGSTV
jgi:hypothetical protein